VLAGFTLIWVTWDAIFGRQLLAINMFLFHGAAAERLIEQITQTVSQGGGVAALLGNILGLLPLALIDTASNTGRTGRWILWGTALIAVFYNTGAGRGDLMMAVMAIALGRSSDWRRLFAAGGLALGIFFAASVFRGDFAVNPRNPLVEGILAPYFNLFAMLKANCGTAPWYNFVLEFLKKFLPGFLFPKTIFSFNVQMSWCINPSDANLSNGVSIFGWLSEIYYYTPSFVTALIAGIILAVLVRATNRQFLKQRLFSARLLAGLICFYLPRSRTQDVFSYLIAQLIFLIFIWPSMCNLMRTLRRLIPATPADTSPQPRPELS
jgi:hypothetical protein